MTDNKLDKLIEEYGRANVKFFQPSTDGLFKQGEKIHKAKQAILDYVEKEKEEALKPIRDVWEKYKDDATLFDHYYKDSAAFDLWQAIKTALGEK